LHDHDRNGSAGCDPGHRGLFAVCRRSFGIADIRPTQSPNFILKSTPNTCGRMIVRL
jgi:hypothetical protein